MTWHTASENIWHIYDIHTIHNATMHGMILMHTWLPLLHRPQDKTCIVLSVYTHYTLGTRPDVKQYAQSRRLVGMCKCNNVWCGGCVCRGADELIDKSPKRPTIYNFPNVQWLHTYYNTYNITIFHISDTGGNHAIKSDKNNDCFSFRIQEWELSCMSGVL